MYFELKDVINKVKKHFKIILVLGLDFPEKVIKNGLLYKLFNFRYFMLKHLSDNF